MHAHILNLVPDIFEECTQNEPMLHIFMITIHHLQPLQHCNLNKRTNERTYHEFRER